MKTNKIIQQKLSFGYRIFLSNLQRILFIFFLILIFWYKLYLIVHAESNIISVEDIEYYLKLVQNDYNVFRQNPFILPDEIYQGWCDPSIIMPKQRYDSYCLDPDVIKNHVTGVQPAIECCNFWGKKWHWSYVIYLKNADLVKPYYPGWEATFYNPKINPDFVPVPQGTRYGFSDFERGDKLFKWSFYCEAQLLVNWYDSGTCNKTVEFINNNPYLLELEDSVYARFMECYNSGEMFRSIENARNFLDDIKIKGITLEKPSESSAFAITLVVTVIMICCIKSILGWF